MTESKKNKAYYKRGVKKLHKDLDVLELIDSFRQSQIVKNVNYSPDQKFLMQFSKRNVIASNTESSDREVILEISWRRYFTKDRNNLENEMEKLSRNILEGLENNK